MLITARALSFTRQHQRILDNVSLEVKPRDFISVIGPNGAGKSSLLKILLGVQQPDSGTVQRAPALRVGYMPQKLMIEPMFPLTVRHFLKLARKSIPGALDIVAEEVGITAALEKPLASLSGGELQRVLLARALLGNPDILMLDEPVQNLDVQGQVHFYALLEKVYQNRQLAILMVSHDLHMVMRATRKVICLYHHICCEGEPQAVSQHPRFIELFGHDMSQMLKVYPHHHSHTHDDHTACAAAVP